MGSGSWSDGVFRSRVADVRLVGGLASALMALSSGAWYTEVGTSTNPGGAAALQQVLSPPLPRGTAEWSEPGGGMGSNTVMSRPGQRGVAL